MTGTTRISFAVWLIRAIGVIVPRRLRADWRQEWEAELRYREELLADWERLNLRNKLDLIWRSSSAFWDALWLQSARWEDEMFQDFRFGCRMLLKTKTFTAVALLSLALGIGANTALFSVVDAVMLRALPVSHPEELVLLRWRGGKLVFNSYRGSTEKDDATGVLSSTSMSYPVFERFQDQSATLASVFAFAELGKLNLNADGLAEMATVQVVSGNYFADLGVQPGLGRLLTNEDESASGEPAAVIGYAYWLRRFGADPEVIGKVVYVSNLAFTIVGVTPPEFSGTLGVGSVPDITLAMKALARSSPRFNEYLHSPSNWWLHIIGRLKPDASAAPAQAELTAILQRHIAEWPSREGVEIVAPEIRLSSGSQGLDLQRQGFSSQFATLMAIVGLVLLIACVNLANLLLARGARRGKELAVRASLGATRLRLVRQLLIESALLAGFGGGLGLLFAYWGKDALLALLTASYDAFAERPKLDLRVLGFTAAASLLTAVLFGLVPALRATRIDLAPSLKEQASSSGPPRSRIAKALVIAQVAMSLLLLVSAGLFVGTLRNLNRIDAGFNTENLLIFKVSPRYETAKRARLYREMTESIAAAPGVRAVSSSQDPLMAGYYSGQNLTIPGSSTGGGDEGKVRVASVAPDFLTIMEIPLLAGREFTAQDDQKAPGVVVVNQALAERYFPGQHPVGQRVSLNGKEMEVIGVARDAKYGGIREEIEPVAYLAYLQTSTGPPPEMSFAVRTVGDPAVAIAAIRQAVQSIDRNIPLFDVRSQREIISRGFARPRLFAVLSSFFGLLALALVCIGLYGVMSYSVSRRTREIGIRKALGARSGDILKIVLSETLILVAAGLAIGLGAALATTKMIESQLFGLAATDPLTIALAASILMITATVAGYLPARRATRVDPMVALRYE